MTITEKRKKEKERKRKKAKKKEKRKKKQERERKQKKERKKEKDRQRKKEYHITVFPTSVQRYPVQKLFMCCVKGHKYGLKLCL